MVAELGPDPIAKRARHLRDVRDLAAAPGNPDDEEEAALVGAVTRNGTPGNRALLVNAAHAGLRAEELCGLEPAHMHTNKRSGYAEVYGERDERWAVPLNSTARAALHEDMRAPPDAYHAAPRGGDSVVPTEPGGPVGATPFRREGTGVYTELICTPQSFRAREGPRQGPRARWLDGETDFALAQAIWPPEAPLSREGWEEAHEQDCRYCALVEGGGVASLGAVWAYSEDQWEVAAIYTAPRFRRRGHATAVVRFPTAHTLDSGRVATCTTEPDDTAMIATAEGVGFGKA